jgi:hypothetical protein
MIYAVTSLVGAEWDPSGRSDRLDHQCEARAHLSSVRDFERNRVARKSHLRESFRIHVGKQLWHNAPPLSVLSGALKIALALAS